ncbi:hypothetical protein A1Q1_01096 [Trichosporon asahii var. asahii CBS 2479]|uniref:Uncharacterized protein n=1 Tax=Trichosporon asahii var. asahii (strain ATCC 90039 / CBS 2479 / JCM 2466 / KCTC 7840 / NBRC 103889/ NCYC 2677 / UAMH 7654) TaxID=1186058 RepID=J4UEN4_TRIAS|nr:hypothetical protein A1Q1_01096 [Trichosporon asahii var. asahii CBS 2479]EJT49740.1 hypothetical protein A1Q1_01096 [Trichosporon asahii var. asahii CBS 2479]
MPLLETISVVAGLIAVTGTVGTVTVSFVWLDPALGHPLPSGTGYADRDWSPINYS